MVNFYVQRKKLNKRPAENYDTMKIKHKTKSENNKYKST